MTGTVAARRPLVIAHRGASGYLPEHTLAGKALAHAQGADFLEQDVVASRDGALLVFHDLVLDELTDVAECFPGRARADGLHYVIDFDLAELRRLKLGERRLRGSRDARFPARFPADRPLFGLVTLEQELQFIDGLNKSSGRRAGIYTEIKEPEFHRRHGMDLGRAVLDVLEAHGYRGPDDPAWVQCFDPAELVRLKAGGSRLKRVQLLPGERPAPADAVLRDIAGYADAVGPSLRLVLEARDGRPALSDFVARARAAGLAVHPWTLRADALPPGLETLEALLDLLAEAEVDGVFTDFPDRAVRWRENR